MQVATVTAAADPLERVLRLRHRIPQRAIDEKLLLAHDQRHWCQIRHGRKHATSRRLPEAGRLGGDREPAGEAWRRAGARGPGIWDTKGPSGGLKYPRSWSPVS